MRIKSPFIPCKYCPRFCSQPVHNCSAKPRHKGKERIQAANLAHGSVWPPRVSGWVLSQAEGWDTQQDKETSMVTSNHTPTRCRELCPGCQDHLRGHQTPGQETQTGARPWGSRDEAAAAQSRLVGPCGTQTLRERLGRRLTSVCRGW